MGTMVVVLVFGALFLGGAWEMATLASQPTRLHGIRWSASTHTFALASTSPTAITEALRTLPARCEFGEAVLMTREGKVALRRQFSPRERRFIWLYQFEVRQAGSMVTLDARETVPLLLAALTIVSALALLWAVPVFALICIVVLGAVVLLKRRTQPSELESAFAFLEKQIRDASEVQ